MNWNKLKYIFINTVLLLCLFAAAAGWAKGRKEDYPDPSDTSLMRITDPIPVDPKVRIGTLANGLTYYIRHNERPENQLVLRLVVNAGSILETDEQRGLAHVVEHMAFNGTARFEKNEIIDYLEGIGMRFGPEINAYTSFDETVYKLTIPTEDGEILEKGFQILSDWAFHVNFEEEEIDKERGVVIEEWRLGRGAQARMRDKYFPLLLSGSRYAERLPIGKKEVLENFDYETLKSFYRDWYRPDLMAVVAVGDYPEDELERLITTYFADEKSEAGRKERREYEVPHHAEPLYSVVTDKEATNTLVRVMIKHDPEKVEKVEDYRDLILTTMYNRMFNQRLEELTQQADPPFIYAVSSMDDFVRTKSIYEMTAVVPEGGAEKGLTALLTEAKRVRTYGFTEGELKRVREELRSGYKRAYEERDKTESFQFAREYIANFLTGEVIPGIAYEYELFERYAPGIELEEVNDLAEKLITEENRVILVTGPEHRGELIPDTDRLAAVYQKVEDAEIGPYVDSVATGPLFSKSLIPGKVVSEKVYKEYGITEWVLGNGARVFLRPSDYKNKEILLSAVSPGGVSAVSDEEYVSAMMIPSIIGVSGVDGFSATELQKLLAGKQVSLTPTLGNIVEGFSGSSTPEDAEVLFQLLHLYMTAVRGDQDAFASLKTRLKGLVANRLSQPEAVYSDRLQEIVSQGHYRRRPLSSEVLEEMDLETALEVYRDHFSEAGDFTFFIAGNVDKDRLKTLVSTYIGSLPEARGDDAWRDEGIRFPDTAVREEVYAGVEEKSRVTLIFGGPLAWTYKRGHLFDSLRQVLDIRLREVIREDASGTYDVGVAGGFGPFPREDYLFQIYFGCGPDRAEELTAVLMEELKEVRRNAVDEKILAKVREQQRTEFEKAEKKNRFWVNVMRDSVLFGLSYDELLNIEGLIESVTAGNIRNIAAEVLNFDRYVLGTLYPETMKE